MSTSKKQIAANRRNAGKSTGPKTRRGKKASSRNAITHGLYARDIVIDSPHLKEDPEQFRHLVTSLTGELEPVGMFEQHLVLKIATCLWRFLRAVRAETADINYQLGTEDLEFQEDFLRRYATGCSDDSDIASMLESYIGRRSISTSSVGARIQYYQMRLDRQLTRACLLLRQFQSMRGKTTPDLPDESTAPCHQTPTGHEKTESTATDNGEN